MNNKLEEGDRITIHTKDGRQHIGAYCRLPNGYIGLSDQRLAIPRTNIHKIIVNHRGKHDRKIKTSL